MVLIRLEIWVKVFGFEVSFCRNLMSDLRICWVWVEESKVIKVARLVSFALMLGVGCRLFRWICGGVDVVTGRAGKSRCSVKLTFGLGLVCCLCFIIFGHSVEEAWCPPPQRAHLSGRCRLGHTVFRFYKYNRHHQCSAQGHVLHCKLRYHEILPKAGFPLQTQEPRLPFY